MKHGRQVRDRWASLPLYLVCLLLIISGACVKFPRQTSQLSEQTIPVVSQADPAPAPLININTAPPEELEKLPGIGKALAARIVAFREQYGLFRRAEHLLMVRGISDRRFQKMRALITAE